MQAGSGGPDGGHRCSECWLGGHNGACGGGDGALGPWAGPGCDPKAGLFPGRGRREVGKDELHSSGPDHSYLVWVSQEPGAPGSCPGLSVSTLPPDTWQAVLPLVLAVGWGPRVSYCKGAENTTSFLPGSLEVLPPPRAVPACQAAQTQ